MFRFTIRDLLWLMVVVGLGMAWWANSMAWTRYHDEVVRDLKDTNKKLWGTGIDLTVRNSHLERENTDLIEQLKKASTDENQPALFNP